MGACAQVPSRAGPARGIETRLKNPTLHNSNNLDIAVLCFDLPLPNKSVSLETTQ